MFGLRRREPRETTERRGEVSPAEQRQRPSMKQPEIDASPTGHAEVDESPTGHAEVEPRYIETAADLPFLTVLADLDTALAKLSGICDGLEAAIDAWSMPRWDPSMTDVTELDETATTSQLVA
jgi:hypothetical protein